MVTNPNEYFPIFMSVDSLVYSYPIQLQGAVLCDLLVSKIVYSSQLNPIK